MCMKMACAPTPWLRNSLHHLTICTCGPVRAELVVNQNEDLLGADLSDAEAALNALKPLIMGRAKRSFEEVISTCSLERAHMLATNDARSMPAGTDIKSLVYGEIDFVSFYEVMQLAAQGHRPRSRRGAKFYDLGSGSGSAIFAACLAVDLRYAIGVELLESVHKSTSVAAAALRAAALYAGAAQVSLEVLQSFTAMAAPYLASPPLVKLYRGDFMAAEFDWTDADLVFAHSTCFEEDLLRRISRRAKRMRPGTSPLLVFILEVWLNVVDFQVWLNGRGHRFCAQHVL
ncbi:hypothetical protein JKP88DRAFT_252975 [Tribonema minus]|uniref:Histone-lysine N-methyltransferase, H3 lysine-79 specific n=1 Tax=Tribonema minus TaxID=303371 RepID=A0A836CL46_9STRA|nr:hypothetical protein JKP88DRAFT_252975 [Tribonema minus]